VDNTPIASVWPQSVTLTFASPDASADTGVADAIDD